MANIGWDAGRIHTAQVLPPQQADNEQATMDKVQELFYAFIQQFHINGVYIYRYVSTSRSLLVLSVPVQEETSVDTQPTRLFFFPLL